ncbi:MAG: hypothetical protein ACE5FJ_09945, partial [Gemmatimonadales bacterium]
MTRRTFARLAAVAFAMLPFNLSGAQGPERPQMTNQPGVKVGGSENVELLNHLPLGGFFRVTDVELEQDADRPYAYVSQARERAGFSIIDISDPENAHAIFRWTIENVDLHQGLGGMDGKYFKIDDRYYFAQSMQFGQGGPDGDLGAVVFDVTDLPNVSRVREVARIYAPDFPG